MVFRLVIECGSVTAIDIYIGSPVEHGSDRAVLKRVAEILSEKGDPAIILANVNLGHRQIDLVVALDRLTLVIEAKGYTVAVRGDENGKWQFHAADGGWKNFENPYLQTVNAKHILRDEMREFSGNDVAYPSAALVFSPSIPAGSSPYPGDFKAEVIGLDAVDNLLNDTDQSNWSLENWRAFARHKHLSRVDHLEAALDPKIAAAEDLIRTYVSVFQQNYGSLTDELIPYPCGNQQEPFSSTDVIELGATGDNLLLSGPSGCGKSLAAFRICMQSIDRGRLPIFIQGKNFNGNLRDAMDSEVTLLDMPSITTLLSACQRLNYPILLLIDGYNECSPAERSRLTRSLAAVARRIRAIASVIVTTHSSLEREELLKLRLIAVPEPDSDTKLAIARQASADRPLHDSVELLLASVGSGLEARLLGEIGRDISNEPSRYSIFDAYVRKRLGEVAVDGIRALTRIAGFLSDRISFGLTVRELDRLCEQEGIPAGLVQRMYETNLLTKRGDRASFGHELFLNAFTAESIIRRAYGKASDLSEMLRSPRHEDRRTLIVGAIDDDTVSTAVLAEIADATLIGECLSGQCGAHARIWADRRVEEVIGHMRAEIEQVEFEIGDATWGNIQPVEENLFQWTPQENAFLHAIGYRVWDGHQLVPILDAIAAMDRRLAHERKRLRDAARDKKVALRSEIFASVYEYGNGTAIGKVFRSVQIGLFHRTEGSIIATLVYQRLQRDDISHGQLHFLLALSRRFLADRPSIAPLLPNMLRRYWGGAAYHLRLGLLEAAQLCGRATETDRINLVQALEELPSPRHPFLSGSLMEALQSLGALEESEHQYADTVRSEIRSVLADRGNPDMQSLAFSVWFRQFDHPYAHKYYEAISDLSFGDKKTLLLMAGQGAEQEPLFLTPLIVELASCNDPAACPVIIRWTSLPPVTCIMPKDSIQGFITAHIALARLGCAIPESATGFDSDSGEALAACGRILYWLNRSDLAMEDRQSECEPALSTLACHELGVSAAVLDELYGARSSRDGLSRLPGSESVCDSIGEVFPAEIAEICRQCLRFPARQQGYFRYFDHRAVLSFAINALGVWGESTDIALLRELSSDPQLGSDAIRSIRKLEQDQAPILP